MQLLTIHISSMQASRSHRGWFLATPASWPLRTPLTHSPHPPLLARLRLGYPPPAHRPRRTPRPPQGIPGTVRGIPKQTRGICKPIWGSSGVPAGCWRGSAEGFWLQCFLTYS